MRLPATVIALCALGAAAGPGVAQVPNDLTRDPLDRATILTLPSVYRVSTTHQVAGLVTSSGREIPLPGRLGLLREFGTAFAVAPNGVLVGAKHVLDPSDASIIERAVQSYLARRGQDSSKAATDAWIRGNSPTLVGRQFIERIIRQADAGSGSRGSRTWPRQRVIASDAARDLTLVKLPKAQGAPALILNDAETLGTPIVALGFGRAASVDPSSSSPTQVPTARKGRIDRTGRTRQFPDGRFTKITAPIQNGDSGGPVIDADGEVRGAVRWIAEGGGIIEQSVSIRAMLTEAGIKNEAGPSGTLFRQGMTAFWALDLPAAEDSLKAASAAFPDHASAARLADRATRLEQAPVSFVRTGGARDRYLALATLFGLLAAGCVALLMQRPVPPPRPVGVHSLSRELD